MVGSAVGAWGWNRGRPAAAWPRRIGRTASAGHLSPIEAPWEFVAEGRLDRGSGVDRERVDRETSVFAWKSRLRLGQPQVMPDYIHQIGSIRPVEDGERRLEANPVGILPQDSSADSVERASPRQVDLAYAHGCTGDPFDTAGHVESSPAGERQQQNPVRIDAVDNEVCDPVGQGLGLA